MSKNSFVIDNVKDDDNDLEDLRALQQVKQEISRKKKLLKDKDYLAAHPDIEELVQKHRRKKIEVKADTVEEEPEEQQEPKGRLAKAKKVQLEVKETKADIQIKKPQKQEPIDYDVLADKLVSRMRKKKKQAEPKQEPKQEPKSEREVKEKEFNDKLDQLPKVDLAPKKTIAKGGKWF